MAVRVFSSSVIVLDEGTLDNIFNGAFTIAVLFKRSGSTTDGFQALLSFNGGVNTNQRASIGYSSASALQITLSGLSRTFGASFTIANDTWYLFVVRKASGTATPTANLYNYSTGAWVGWTNGSGTLDNDATALVEVRLGNAPGGFPLNGKMGGAVVYNSVLSDTNGETLETSAQNWFALSPTAMWRLNQASTATPVTDDTGNGADQTSITGTSVDAVDNPGPTPVFDFNLGGLTISPTGIASGEALGTPTITPGAVTISPTGIASGEAFGTPTITPGAVTIAPTGIASGEAFGTPTITPGPVTVAPTGIASGEAFGTPTITPGAVTISPTGIASAEAFGTPVVADESAQVVGPTGIASGEAFGTPTLTPGPVTISPAGIASAEAFGTPVVAAGPVTVAPTGIASGEVFGTPVITTGQVTISPTGIASAEAFGTPTITDASQGQIIAPTGIPSGERFGHPVVWSHIVRACDCSVLVDD